MVILDGSISNPKWLYKCAGSDWTQHFKIRRGQCLRKLDNMSPVSVCKGSGPNHTGGSHSHLHAMIGAQEGERAPDWSSPETIPCGSELGPAG